MHKKFTLSSYKSIVLVLAGLLACQAAGAVEAGDSAPPIQLPLLQMPPGQTAGQAGLDDEAGKIVYLDFWASWCAPCQVSMPIMNAMRNRLQAEGIPFEVVAVNVDSDPEDGLDFLLDNPVDFVVLADPAGETPARYGVRGMPTSYLIDAGGDVVMTHVGFKRSDADMIEKRIRDLAGDMP